MTTELRLIGFRYVRGCEGLKSNSADCDIVNHRPRILHPLRSVPAAGDGPNEKTRAPQLPSFDHSVMGRRDDSGHALIPIISQIISSDLHRAWGLPTYGRPWPA